MSENIAHLPIRSGDKPADLNASMFFARADKAMEAAVSEIQSLLLPLTYEQVVRISDMAVSRVPFDGFLCDAIGDELGRRYQEIDPEHYPPEGAA